MPCHTGLPWHEWVLIWFVAALALVGAGKWLLDQLGKAMD